MDELSWALTSQGKMAEGKAPFGKKGDPLPCGAAFFGGVGGIAGPKKEI